MSLTADNQIRNFPSLNQMERSWEQNLRVSLGLLAPGEGIRSGLKLGLPKTGGLVTTGLLPTLTNGYLVKGDNVLGPYGSKFAIAAEKNWVNKTIYFGLKGMAYGNANNAAPYTGDVLIGSLSTDNLSTAAIQHLGQQYNYGAARFAVRGVVNLAKCAKGADTTFFTWRMPTIGLDNVRVSYASARVTEAVTAGNTAGDDFVLKVKQGASSAINLATIGATALATAGSLNTFGFADADAVVWNGINDLTFQFNQTDTSTAIAGGEVEVYAELVAF